MSWVPRGSFLMGSEDFYPEERPVHRVEVEGFWMDQAPVTAGEYRRFVRETGYVTVAERPLDPELYPDADPELLVPGSLVFRKTSGPVNLDDVRNWWAYIPGAYWKRPGVRMTMCELSEGGLAAAWGGEPFASLAGGAGRVLSPPGKGV